MFHASPHSSPLAIVVFCFAVSGCSSGGDDSGNKNDSAIDDSGTNIDSGANDKDSGRQPTDGAIVQHGGCVVKGFAECTAQTDAASCNAAGAACKFQYNSCVPDPIRCADRTSGACEEVSYCKLSHRDKCFPICANGWDEEKCKENTFCAWNGYFCSNGGDCRNSMSTTEESCLADPACVLMDPYCYYKKPEAKELCKQKTTKNDCESEKDCEWRVARCEQAVRACGDASMEACAERPACKAGFCESTCAFSRDRAACEAESDCEWVSVAYRATDDKARCSTGCHIN